MIDISSGELASLAGLLWMRGSQRKNAHSGRDDGGSCS